MLCGARWSASQKTEHMHTRIPSLRWGRTRRIVASAMAITLAFFTLSMFIAPAANAAEPQSDDAGNTVVFDRVELASTEFADGSSQKVFVEWHVEGEATAPLTIAVPLPEPLIGNHQSFPIEGPDGIIGSCEISDAGALCTIDDAEYLAANPYRVHGEFEFSVHTALDNRTTEHRTVELGGVEVELTIDPNGAWCPDDCSWKGQGAGKGGGYYRADWREPEKPDHILWGVDIAAPADGLPGGLDIVVEDPELLELYTVEETHVLVADSARTDKYGREYLEWRDLPADAVDWNADRTRVSWTTIDPRPAGPLEPSGTDQARRTLGGAVYAVQWWVSVDDGGKAKTYRNTAHYTIDGVESGELSGSTNWYSYSGKAVGTNFGRIELTKQLAGDTAFSPARAFDVTVEAYDGEQLINTERASLHAGESFTTQEYFKGTRLVVTEAPVTGPANVVWGEPDFADEASGGTAVGNRYEVVIDPLNGNVGKLSEITLTNTATLQRAAFSASKQLVNPDGAFVDPEAVYQLQYAYPANGELGIPAGSGTLELTADGTVVTSPELPVGAEVTLTELQPASVPAATWQPARVEPSSFTVGEDGSPVAAVAVTNTIARDYGGFAIRKSVTGDGAGHVPADTEYRVHYAYPAGPGFDAGDGELAVRADGEPVVIDGLPAGAEVTLAEAAPDPVTGTSWLDPVFSETVFTVVHGQTVEIDLENPIALNTGAFEVSKRLDGTGADLVGADRAFVVDYAYPAGIGFEAGSGELVVPADGTAVSSGPLPYGAEVSLSERAPDEVPGGTWTGHAFSPETLTIGDGTVAEVELTNTIRKHLGSVSLVKHVSGTGAALVDGASEFVFDYAYPAGDWFAAGSGTVAVTADGTPTVLEDVPAGAVVAFTERTPDAVEGGVWHAPVYANGASVVVEDGGEHLVEVDNELERTTGTVSVRKALAGPGAALVDPDTVFAVKYRYPAGDGYDAGSGVLLVPADGTAATSPELPYGAVVELAESDPAAQRGFEWVDASFSSDTVTIADGVDTAVTLTNTTSLTPGEPLANTSGGTPSATGLASTGVEPGLAAALAALLAAAGTGLLLAMRRRRARA